MKNYFTLAIDEQITLIQPMFSMAEKLYELVDQDREHLRRFLDFVDITTKVEDETNYLKMKLTGYVEGTDCLFLIGYEGEIVGSIDIHFINQQANRGEIGYMISSSYTNKGIVTKCVKKVCEIAFEELGLNKLALMADVENLPSNKVAQKAGFSLVGTLKEEILMYEQYRDLNRYELLKSEFYEEN